MSSTIIGIPGLKLPDAWELERLQSGNPARLVQTQAQSASALLKASAAINIVTRMLRERDRASVPSPMRSPPLQMNALKCLLCPPQAPVYFPLHARPLPLQRRALLRVLSLARTDPRRTHSYIWPQAECRGSRFRVFPQLRPVCIPPHARPLPLQRWAPLRLLSLARTDPRRTRLHIRPQALHRGMRFRSFPPPRSGMRLRHLLPHFRSWDILGITPRQVSGLK